MSAPYRNPSGGRIERAARCDFRFDGRPLEGVEGDTLASALLAQGVRFIGRSIKFRRPRGILTAGPEEPNALVTLGAADRRIPNVPATVAALSGGLVAESQNRWPSLRFDVAAALLGRGSGLLGAGFYYKTFMWPSWGWYEPLIRRLAGLGPAPQIGPALLPGERHLDCDVLVIGAGPAGLAAALAAVSRGARVIVCEQDALPGGELQFESGSIEAAAASAWPAQAAVRLRAAGAQLLTGTTAFGCYDERVFALRQPQGYPSVADELLIIRSRARIIATGAPERPVVFANNDRPGVMLLGAVERFASRFAVRAGDRAVLFGNHDRLYPAALRLAAAGIRIAAVVDSRPRADQAAASELERQGVRILSEYALESALGEKAVRGALVRSRRDESALVLECDVIAVSGGWTPAAQLAVQSGLALRFAESLGAFVAVSDARRMLAAGAVAGELELSRVLASGWSRGLEAARAVAAPGTVESRGLPAPQASADPGPHLQPLWRIPHGTEKHQFVDLQNDVTVADLRQAVAEGFCEIEHIKRYTTLGVGTEQGKTGGLVGAAIAAELLGVPLAELGASRVRPPVRPVPLGVLAGAPAPSSVRPLRETPLHERLIAAGGLMEPSGLWLRARHYRGPGPIEEAAIAEARQVRSSGGLFDASTLGKIEVAGPDAARFIDWIYLARPSRTAVGRSRYAVLLREDGMVLDDGLVARLAPEHFLLTTSTHGAAAVLSHLEYHLARSAPALNLSCADVTDAWGVIVVAGPNSATLLQRVLTEPLRALALTHMGWVATHWQGRPLRVIRASFSGERAYELHCAADVAPSLWDALTAAGGALGIAPYGLDALDILRIEKGYLTSAEITGQVSPHDLRLSAMVHASAHCIGLELLARPGLHEGSRPLLVGLVAADASRRFNGGAQLLESEAAGASLGYVTSAAWSPARERTVALALLARARAQIGASLIAADPLHGEATRVLVTEPVHFDPAGERIRA